MTYCSNCGKHIAEGVKFCPSCGAAAPSNGQAAHEAPNRQDAESDAQDNKAMGVLSYLGPLVLVPIFAAKESQFVRFHANQGLVLALFEVAFGIVYSILISILTGILLRSGAWGLWSFLTTVMGLLWLVFVALSVLGIVNVINGKMRELPVIGHIKILK